MPVNIQQKFKITVDQGQGSQPWLHSAQKNKNNQTIVVKYMVV